MFFSGFSGTEEVVPEPILEVVDIALALGDEGTHKQRADIFLNDRFVS